MLINSCSYAQVSKGKCTFSFVFTRKGYLLCCNNDKKGYFFRRASHFDAPFSSYFIREMVCLHFVGTCMHAWITLITGSSWFFVYNGSILWIRFSGGPIALLVNVFILGVYASLTFNAYVYYSQLSGRECFWQQSKFFRLNRMECFWHKKSDCLARAPPRQRHWMHTLV